MAFTPNTAFDWSAISAANYSPIARLTIPPIRRLFYHLPTLGHRNAYIMDNGCGSGALTLELKSVQPAAKITASDPSPGMVAQLQSEIETRGWAKDIETRVLDMQNLAGIDDETFTHVLSSFTVQFLSDPEQALSEMARVLQCGGWLGITVWDGRLSFAEPWEEAVRDVTGDTNHMAPPEIDYPIGTKDVLRPLLARLGFDAMKIEGVSSAWGWKSHEEALGVFYEGAYPAAEALMRPWRDGEFWDRIKEGFEWRFKRDVRLGEEGREDAFLIMARKRPDGLLVWKRH